MLLVSLSRVRKGADIRILPLTHDNDINHIKDLKWDEDLEIWLEGYKTLSRKWSKDICVRYLQEKANSFRKDSEDHKSLLSSRLPNQVAIAKSLRNSNKRVNSNKRTIATVKQQQKETSNKKKKSSTTSILQPKRISTEVATGLEWLCNLLI